MRPEKEVGRTIVHVLQFDTHTMSSNGNGDMILVSELSCEVFRVTHITIEGRYRSGVF